MPSTLYRSVCCRTVLLALLCLATLPAQDTPVPGRVPADLTRKVQVFILLGQSNMVGLGKVTGGEGSLEHAVKQANKYPWLIDDAGRWSERQDVRYVRVMSGRGGGMQQFNNEWMTVATCKTIGPEFGIGHHLGDALTEPVLILKSCIGNRSLGWDLLPPGSERFLHSGKVHAAYGEKPPSWPVVEADGLATAPPPFVDKAGKPIDWHAGKQWDDDIAHAKKILEKLPTYYPGAQGYEVAGFFFWQGEKDAGDAGHAERYEHNLAHFIRQVRREFAAPTAKFVLATMGESKKGGGGNGGKILDAHLAVDGTSGKYPEFAGNVATIYTHPLAQGGSGNGHYGGKAEVYMDVGEAMGKAMVRLLRRDK